MMKQTVARFVKSMRNMFIAIKKTLKIKDSCIHGPS